MFEGPVGSVSNHKHICAMVQSSSVGHGHDCLGTFTLVSKFTIEGSMTIPSNHK